MDKVCVFGAGAIGGLLGAALVRGGTQVSLVARGPHLSAIREHGIRVRRPAGPEERARPDAASDDPATLGPQDVVLVTVKSGGLPQVAARIAPLLSPDTAVAFVVNGIPWWYDPVADIHGAGTGCDRAEINRALRRIVDPERAIGGVAYSACTVVEPGVIQLAGSDGRFVLGEVAGPISARVRTLAGLIEAGGLPCDATPDIRAAVWLKLLTNLAGGPICLMSRRSLRESLSDPALRAAAIRLVEEGRRVASAVLGHALAVDAGALVDRLGSLDHKPSVLQDLEQGRPTEFETLFGLPQTFARRLGVETPTLDLMLALAERAAGTDPHDRSDIPCRPPMTPWSRHPHP